MSRVMSSSENTSSSDETIDFEHEYTSDDENDYGPVKPLNNVGRQIKSLEVVSNLSIKNQNDENLDKKCETIYQVLGQNEIPSTSNSSICFASLVNKSVSFPANVSENLIPITQDLKIPSELLDVLKKHTSVFFPVQQAVLPFLTRTYDNLLPPQDVVICSPTGSGKTLAYALPILSELRNVQLVGSLFALIVAPVFSLVQQIYQEFLKFNVFNSNIAVLGRTGCHSEQSFLSNCTKAHVLITTPRKIVEHLVDDSYQLDLSSLRYLVVDEADRMQDTARMEWLDIVERRSNVSESAIINIKNFTSNSHNRWFQKILVSATMSLDVDNLYMWKLRCPLLFQACSNNSTRDPSLHTGQTATANNIVLPSSLDYTFALCRIGMKPALLYSYLMKNGWSKVVVFVNEKITSHRLHLLLSKMCSKFQICEFSSNLYGKRRSRLLKRFQSGEIRVLIACDLLSRGIDITNLDCVINYDAPVNERVFLHRAGRTARALSSGTLITFVTKEEKMRLKMQLSRHELWSEEKYIRDAENELISEKIMKLYEKGLRSLESVVN